MTAGVRLTAMFVAAGVLVSCARVQPHRTLRHANVLLITLDTTRADHLGPYGYSAAQTPTYDALAKRGIVFDECITPTAYTLPSHSSILTGLYPPAHGVRINGENALGDSQTTLAERLSAKGYRTGAFVAAFVLDGRWGLSQGFQNYDDHFKIAANEKLDLAGVRRPGNEVVDAALKWLGQPSSQPFFAWVHLYDAHTPYRNNRYDDGIAFADAQVARLLAYLDQKHIRDNTLVVIVADHGEGLGDHGEQEHGYYVYDATVHVPLIIEAPGFDAARVKAQVRTIDVAPTIMDAVAGERPADMQGQSLLPVISGEEKTTRYAYSESMAVRLQYGWSALYALRTNDFKFIDAPRSELYDLKSDPNEAANKLDDERRVARDLRDRLQQVRAESDKRAPKVEEANVDQETLRKLASLGYLGGASSSSTNLGDDHNLPDPKDKMHLYDSVGYAANLVSHNDYKKAIQVLDIVLKDDPNVPQAQMLLVSALRNTSETARARQILDQYLKRDPSNTHALIAMAEILDEEGRVDDVMAICKRALSVDPRNARAYEVMADVYMTRNDHRDALPLLRKAVEIQPKLNRSQLNLAVALMGVGQFDESQRLLNSIVQQYPKFPLVHYHLALLRERQGNAAAAKSEYETELSNHPQEVAARFNLGNLLLHTGDTAGAEKQMRTLIKDDPSGPRPYLLLAQTLLDQPGRLGEVESLAHAGLERAKEPDLKALGYFLLADVYSREGRRTELQNAVRMGEHYKSLIRS